MKKTLAFLAALAMVLSTVACGKKQECSIPEQTAVNEAEVMAFKSASIQMGDDFETIFNTDKRGAYYLILGQLKSGEYCVYMTDTKFAEKKVLTLDIHEDEKVRCGGVMPGGKVAVMTTLGNHTFIYTFAADLTPENTYDIEDIFDTEDRFGELICADDGFYINIARHDIAYIDKEGNFKGNVNVGTRTVSGVTLDNTGAPCALLTDGVKMSLATLSEGSIAEETDCGELTEYTSAICRGEGDFRIAIVANTGMYGLKDGSWVKLTDFKDNDFSIVDITDIDMTGDTDFCATLHINGVTTQMRMLSQMDISEIKQKKVIRMVNTWGSNYDPYTPIIKRFNSENEEYKVEMVNYLAAEGEYDYTLYDGLRADILSGNCPDIIEFDQSCMSVDSFGSADSIFVDMYTLLDKDDDLHREDFLEGFLPGLETKGKLLRITPSFNVVSLLVKDKFTGGLDTWTFEDFERVYKNMPENMDINDDVILYTKTDMFAKYIKLMKFIDADKYECHFDSPEFIRAMKFIKDNNIGVQIGDIAPGTFFNFDTENRFRNDEILTMDAYLDGFRRLKEHVQVYSNGDPCTFIGFPGDTGETATTWYSTTYGIMANSPNIEGAWEFLKYYLFSEDSRTDAHFDGFAGLEKYYLAELDDACVEKSYIDLETGEEVQGEETNFYSADSESLVYATMHAFTPEEREKYDKFIRKAIKRQYPSVGNVAGIVDEELDAYFEGEKTAEETAEIIQNRVSIMLSERS